MSAVDRRSLVRLLDAAAVFLLLAILVGWLLKTPISAHGWTRRDLNDYTLNLRHSREVDANHAYPFGFTYPPPSVLFRLGLGRLGFEFGGGLWIALSGVSLLISIWLAMRLLGWLHRPGAGVLALAALVLVKYPFEFEYKYFNSNAMFLALVLAALATAETRPALAGFFLSLSIALKLYSILFLPWFLIMRRTRVFWWALAFSLGWFVVLPGAVWGGEARPISVSWLERVRETGTPEFPVRFLPYAYLVSLHATVVTAADRLALANQLYTAYVTTCVLQSAWAAAVLLILVRRRGNLSPQLVLSDAALLLLAPLPLSGQLQPHHAVVLLPGALLLLMAAADSATPRRLRTWCVVVLLGTFALMEFWPPKPWRGVAMNATFVLYLTGLAALRQPSGQERPPPLE